MNKIFYFFLLFLTTLYSLGQATSGLLSPTVPTIPATSSGVTYYVENVAGSDANNGTSILTPWKTIAHVNAQTFSAGAQVLFYSTDVWHEQLTVPSSSVYFGAYGPQRNCSLSTQLVANCTNMPIIDGADVVTGWTVYSGANYKASYTSTASKGFVDSLYVQTNPLLLQTSIANVTSTAGSIYSDGTYVYVHLLDGSNPANHVVEVSGLRKYGISIDAAAALTGVTFNGLEIIRAAKAGIDSSLQVYTDTSITVTNNVFFNNGDTLGDTNCGLGGAGSCEGHIFDMPPYTVATTGWVITGNWFGMMDFTDSLFSIDQAGVDIFASSGAFIYNNKFATVHGAALEMTDGYGVICTSPNISYNEFTNSEGNINIGGCTTPYIVYNDIHNSFGNGIEEGPGFQTPPNVPNAPYLGYNTIHDIQSAYAQSLYNGIDTNYATNGVAIGNRIWSVSAASMTLEGTSGAASTGWIVTGNTFDATNNVSIANVCCGGFPMYVMQYSLAGGLTLRGNILVFNPTTQTLIYGGTSSTDTAHEYTQASFDQVYPNAEIPGPSSLSYGVNSNFLTGSGTTITSTSLVTTGLTFPAVPQYPSGGTPGLLHGRCIINWKQSTAAGGVTFGIKASAAPTDLWVLNKIQTTTATAPNTGVTNTYTVITSSTATNISASAAPTFNNVYFDEIDVTLQGSTSAAVTLTVEALTGSGSDSLLIEPGSVCGWLL